MKDLNKIMRQMALLTQFGLSLIFPTLLVIWLCAWLVQDKGVGAWIFIPGFILGIGASAMTGYKFYLANIKKDEKKEKKPAFNRHQ